MKMGSPERNRAAARFWKPCDHHSTSPRQSPEKRFLTHIFFLSLSPAQISETFQIFERKGYGQRKARNLS
jgi:hypothetical protein